MWDVFEDWLKKLHLPPVFQQPGPKPSTPPIFPSPGSMGPGDSTGTQGKPPPPPWNNLWGISDSACPGSTWYVHASIFLILGLLILLGIVAVLAGNKETDEKVITTSAAAA